MKIIAIVSAVVMLLALPVAAENVKIILQGESEVDSTRIRLGDVARIEGAGEKLKELLAALELDKAAPPGYSRKINRSLIKLLLANSELVANNELEYENISYGGESTVRVHTSSRAVTGEEIENFIRQEIAAGPEEELEVELKGDIGDIILPDGEYSLKIGGEEKISRGRNTLRLLVYSGEEVYKRIFITCNVGVKKDVFIAREDLGRGVNVNKSDFENKKELITTGEEIIDSWDETGSDDYILRQGLKKGEVLTREHLELPVLIDRSQMVKLEVISGNVRVHAEVEALQRGRAGETIRVKNLATDRRLQAEVISDELVRIEK
ncbi:MAG: flagellar basal body P-ring formation chaperone FlgA [Bacillota bacterium]